GRMGYGDSTYFTAVGDTVHVAARLGQATKDYDCELVVSEDVVVRAGVDFGAFPRHEVALRNRATPVLVRVIERVAGLPAASVPGWARWASTVPVPVRSATDAARRDRAQRPRRCVRAPRGATPPAGLPVTPTSPRPGRPCGACCA